MGSFPVKYVRMEELRYPRSPKEMEIRECRFRDIRHIFEEFHYKGGHMGGGISTCLMATYEGAVMGGCVIGKPRHGNRYRNMLEIRRMAFLDDAPKFSESWLLGKTIRFLKQNTDCEGVLSYSDQSVGHRGTIYRAANFREVGKTSPSRHVFWNGVRYHPRSLTIDRPYSYRLREAVKNGEATVETGEPKLIFVYKISRKPASA